MLANWKVIGRIQRKLGWAVVALASLLIALGIGYLAPRMAPVRRGDSAGFWKCACAFDLDTSRQRENGWDRGRREDWFYYEIPHLHGTDLYRVPAPEVLVDFDRVVAELQTADADGALRPYVQAGLKKWLEEAEGEQKDAAALLTAIKKTRDAEWLVKAPDVYYSVRRDDELFEARWVRVKWFWATILFEWLYLSGLTLFAAWPFLRGRGWKSYVIRLGLVPLFFMLPVYFGYATMSFTSAGPSGGILYPWLLLLTHGRGCNDLDRLILSHLPPILEPLSPSTGPALVLSSRAMACPTETILMGLVIAIGCFVLAKLFALWSPKQSFIAASRTDSVHPPFTH